MGYPTPNDPTRWPLSEDFDSQNRQKIFKRRRVTGTEPLATQVFFWNLVPLEPRNRLGASYWRNFFASHERVSGFPEKGADLWSGPGNFRGGPGNFQKSPENFWGSLLLERERGSLSRFTRATSAGFCGFKDGPL